jgi:hypothetical protein
MDTAVSFWYTPISEDKCVGGHPDTFPGNDYIRECSSLPTYNVAKTKHDQLRGSITMDCFAANPVPDRFERLFHLHMY